MPSSLVCNGPVVTGLLQTNGRKLVTGAVNAAALAPLVGTVGAAVTPTVGGTAITFGAVQTLPAGFSFSFASQPGTIYALASPITAGTAGVLTTNYTGPAGATTATGLERAVYHTTGNKLTFADVQTLPVGWQFQLNGVGTTYVLTTAVAA